MKTLTEKIKEASDYLLSKINIPVDTAIVLGSGLGDLALEIKNSIIIEYKDIPNFPISTVQGHEGKLIIGNINSKNIIAMKGRFHYYEGYDLNEVTFPIRVFKSIGINKLVLTNAAGGINKSFKPGDLMVINDHINISNINPLRGKNLDEFGIRFPDMSQIYSRNIINKLKDIYKKNNMDFLSGVYAYMLGPSFETPAEIRMLNILGADAVGMSTVPEAIVARHCNMELCAISCITNMAAGILDKPLNHEEVLETSNMVKDKFKTIIKQLIEEIA